MALPKLMIKILNKFHLLSYLNVVTQIAFNNIKHTIPILSKVGIELLALHGQKTWMADIVERLLVIRTGTFVDVGVNLGQTLIAVKSINPDLGYLGFEPNPVCASYVQKLIALNQYANSRLIPSALSMEANVFSFIASSQTDDAGSIVKELRPDKYKMFEKYVVSLKYDDLDFTKEVSTAIVKIDVEGAELDVLLGMKNYLLNHRPFILCEVLHAHSIHQLDFCSTRNHGIMQLLGEINYYIMRIVRNSTVSAATSLEKVEFFPSVVYNDESYKLCDYLFSPSEINVGQVF